MYQYCVVSPAGLDMLRNRMEFPLVSQGESIDLPVRIARGNDMYLSTTEWSLLDSGENLSRRVASHFTWKEANNLSCSLCVSKNSLVDLNWSQIETETQMLRSLDLMDHQRLVYSIVPNLVLVSQVLVTVVRVNVPESLLDTSHVVSLPIPSHYFLLANGHTLPLHSEVRHLVDIILVKVDFLRRKVTGGPLS